MNIEVVNYGEPHYPELLNYITTPPKRLYYRGDISLASKPAIAIVGARKATGYGQWVAYQLARRLAQYGIVSVSGMAYGIDTWTHKGSLENGGKTIAVLGCGPDVCYPASNKKIMEEISREGLILSEYEPGTTPLPYMFPMRNRLISGISISTVIAEAGLKSGSLITAECAAEQGRNIYAVPGNINSVYSIGTNKLIRDGAIPITLLDDIIEDLGIERICTPSQKEKLGKDETCILSLVEKYGEINSDFICRKTGKSPSAVNSIVTILEMKGILQTSLGKIFIAK
ncbi:MAG: DNA-processing protein DprA [Anaerovorax sp.]